jgi:Bacterial alpha-L-rhamnosidase 6 hairpin glycosidase domain
VSRQRARTARLAALAVVALTAAMLSRGLPAAADSVPWPTNPDWQQYVEGPSTPNVTPVAVVSTSGNVTNVAALASGGSGSATLTMASGGAAPVIILDYGKDVGGFPYFTVAAESGSPVLRAALEGPAVYDSLGTNADNYLKQSILLLGSYQLSSGFVTGCLSPQTPVHTGPLIPGTTACYSASYSMYFADDLAGYYRATGDLAFAQQEFPIVQRELAWNASLVNSQGLLVTDTSDGLDWDWYDGNKTGAVTEYNALYYLDLIDGAYLARETGHPDLAAQYTNQAAALRTAINASLFNSSTGVYDVSTAIRGTADVVPRAIEADRGGAAGGEAAVPARTDRGDLCAGLRIRGAPAPGDLLARSEIPGQRPGAERAAEVGDRHVGVEPACPLRPDGVGNRTPCGCRKRMLPGRMRRGGHRVSARAWRLGGGFCTRAAVR